MRRILLTAWLLVAILVVAAPRAWALDAAAARGEPVVLLHGLLRTSASMDRLAFALAADGFDVCNVSYPSRHYSIEVLASDFVAPAIHACFPGETRPIHFVTHSMGGIVARQLASTHAVGPFGRVVMLAPPNHGSELVDEFGHWWIFRRLNGPAGAELGTSRDSVPVRLGPAPFEVGIITGTRTTNLLMSAFLPGRNDGKVSVASARLDGMKDFLEMPVSHTFIMRNGQAIEQAVRFLEHGSFEHAAPRAERPNLVAMLARKS
jgi:pimeloyl-ACP methyl ester carboxylesterase